MRFSNIADILERASRIVTIECRFGPRGRRIEIIGEELGALPLRESWAFDGDLEAGQKIYLWHLSIDPVLVKAIFEALVLRVRDHEGVRVADLDITDRMKFRNS